MSPSSTTAIDEKKLWAAADELRANSKLRPAEYYLPVLGLIFLKYADYRFSQTSQALKAEREQDSGSGQRRRRPIRKDDYLARGVLYLPDEARYERLVQLPEGADISRAVVDAMKAIETHNPMLRDVLPKTYTRLQDETLIALLKIFNRVDMDVEGDVFGKIYEYFLAQFAMSEGRRGGEFFTPTSIVRLIVEVIEPFHGRILDPAAGSGGMFVQSARFVAEHQGDPDAELSIHGQERVAQTARICQMNLAVHGLEGDIRQGNTYYEDIHRSRGKFDFVMANPPFNVNRVDKERIEDDPRFPFSLPSVDNANYLWIQIFYSALNERGRAGFVMANSAADARGSEQEIRKQLIESGAVDVMIAVASNFFYTVTLPCTLWFLDRGKVSEEKEEREDQVLFIDARRIYEQIDRAHREFTPAQIEFLSNIVRLYRGREPEATRNSEGLMGEHFPAGVYRDVAGLCKVATVEEIEAQGWSLNPGRYVGVPEREEDDDFDFEARLMELHEELETLNSEAHALEARIAENVLHVLRGL
jgi:type I restriction enzyme M protein